MNVAQLSYQKGGKQLHLPPIASLPGLPPTFDKLSPPPLAFNPTLSVISNEVLSSEPKAQTTSNKSLKTKFTPEEDLKLMNIISLGFARNWNQVALFMGTRNPRQCRERWNNYLNPNIRNDPWSPMEDALLIQKYKEYGSKWRKISKFFHNRSDNALRNRMQLLERHVNKCPDVTSPEASNSE